MIVVERTNARSLQPGELPFAAGPDRRGRLLHLAHQGPPGGGPRRRAPVRLLALVKPQFEAGRDEVGRGGVVRSADARRAALLAVGRFAVGELGLSLLGYASSGLPGPAGNRESFVWLAEAGREGAAQDLEAAARKAEP